MDMMVNPFLNCCNHYHNVLPEGSSKILFSGKINPAPFPSKSGWRYGKENRVAKFKRNNPIGKDAKIMLCRRAAHMIILFGNMRMLKRLL